MTPLNVKDEDWADLCRRYRMRFGLKQSAFASDFNVSQSTVSRWENGDRIPGRKAQTMLLEAMPAQPASPLPTKLANVMTCGAMPMVVWDRQGILQDCSESFLEEIRSVDVTGDPVGLHADELFANRGMMAAALSFFEEMGFFEDRVVSASLVSPVIGNPGRIAAGGSLITQVHPTCLADNTPGMLCCYVHDVLRVPPADIEISLQPVGAPKPVVRHVPFADLCVA